MLSQDLVWVAVDGDRVFGILIAFMAHRFFYPVRLCGVPNSPYGWFQKLTKKAFRDAMYKGCYYWFTQFGDGKEEKLKRIVLNRGAKIGLDRWVGGRISDLIREKPKMKLVDSVRSARGAC